MAEGLGGVPGGLGGGAMSGDRPNHLLTDRERFVIQGHEEFARPQRAIGQSLRAWRAYEDRGEQEDDGREHELRRGGASDPYCATVGSERGSYPTPVPRTEGYDEEDDDELAQEGVAARSALIEVPLFREVTRDALGGRLCPWLLGMRSHSGSGAHRTRVRVHPVAIAVQPGSDRTRPKAKYLSYRGFKRRLQVRATRPTFALASVVTRLGCIAHLAGS